MTSRQTVFICWRRRSASNLFSMASVARFIASQQFSRKVNSSTSSGKYTREPAILFPPGRQHLKSSRQFILVWRSTIFLFCRNHKQTRRNQSLQQGKKMRNSSKHLKHFLKSRKL